MDREDADLFEDEQTKEIFLEVYEAIDDAKLRYPYRPKNLWTWEHVATAAAKNGHLAGDAIYSYMERNMDIEESQKRIVEAKVMQEMSTTLMKKHWDRYLYYSLCMMPQGFVSTIFMQKEAFYTLCHVITFGLYAAAFVLAVRCIRKRELSSPAGEMMLYTIAVAVMLVCITNIVFMGLQRYMYYMYGVFYIAFFLALRENFKNIIKLR